MKKLSILLLTVLAVMLAVGPAMAWPGGGSGNPPGDEDSINNLIDNHSFTDATGVKIISMTEGNFNQTLADVNVNLGESTVVSGNIQFFQNIWVFPQTSGEKNFNKITDEAFQNVKGVTMIQMVAGNGNMVSTNLNVNVSTGFIKNLPIGN